MVIKTMVIDLEGELLWITFANKSFASNYLKRPKKEISALSNPLNIDQVLFY